MNEWIEKSLVGIVRYTGMMMEDTFHLPAKFTIHFRPIPGLPMFRCLPEGDGPYSFGKQERCSR